MKRLKAYLEGRLGSLDHPIAVKVVGAFEEVLDAEPRVAQWCSDGLAEKLQGRRLRSNQTMAE